jgi:hypothetical protein
MSAYRIRIETSIDGSKTYWPQHFSKLKWFGFDVDFETYDISAGICKIKDVRDWGSSGGNGVFSEECAREIIEFYKAKLKAFRNKQKDTFIYL